MSHLGLRILYSLLNSRREIWAERVFCPWADMEAELRAHQIPLTTLESETPLAEFDIVGFSLQYELNYTNILTCSTWEECLCCPGSDATSIPS